MSDSKPEDRGREASGGKSGRMQSGVLAAVCTLVIGVYAYTASTSYLVSTSLNPADACYNLLVQGFRAGQLSLKKEAPLGLTQLANPYDRAANIRYRVLDLSYYKGKLYLYFGVTPAVLLFWPCVALTGHYLLQKDATLIFCLVGFLASVGLLCALRRRYFAEVSVGVVAAGALALGLTTCTPLLLARCDVYEVAISCGYALTMLVLVALWKALHEPGRRGWWLAGASLACGLAVGARPSLLWVAVILLVPVAQAWRERRPRKLSGLVAATLPLVLIGFGLMVYNALRFDNPFEFGWHYQLAGERQDTVHPFSLRYLWFNIRIYFLEPARWSGRFPFVHDIKAPPLPAGHGGGEHPFGILSNIPLVWLALAVPLAWRDRSAEARDTLRGFLVAVALLFGIGASTLCLLRGANVRYEVEFLPALVLLAVMGILGLERALVCRPVWRRAARWGWGCLLGVSVAFNLLASIERCAKAHYDLGNALFEVDRASEAIPEYEQALRLKPDFADARNGLGAALAQTGNLDEAVRQFEQALRMAPGEAMTHYNLALALEKTGRGSEAIAHWEQALRIKPDVPELHEYLGATLMRMGRVPEAVEHLEEAVRLNPDSAEAHNSLGIALAQLGLAPEAIGHWEQALRIKPDVAEVHYNLGVTLEQAGRVQEASGHYQQALRIKPDYAEARERLVRLRAVQ